MIIKTYKFRLYPTKAQTKTFERTLDLCRELYNGGLQERRDAWTLNRKRISCFDQQNQLPEIKRIREELKQIHSQILQNVLKRLDRSFENFFRRAEKGEKAGYPRFQNRNRYNSFTYPQIKSTVRLADDKLHLSKIGEIKIKASPRNNRQNQNCNRFTKHLRKMVCLLFG